MPTTFINTLMSAGADVVCGAEYGALSTERTEGRRYLGIDVLSHSRIRPATEPTAPTEEVPDQTTIPALSA